MLDVSITISELEMDTEANLMGRLVTFLSPRRGEGDGVSGGEPGENTSMVPDA